VWDIVKTRSIRVSIMIPKSIQLHYEKIIRWIVALKPGKSPPKVAEGE
jgi:hypothetical protein